MTTLAERKCRLCKVEAADRGLYCSKCDRAAQAAARAICANCGSTVPDGRRWCSEDCKHAGEAAASALNCLTGYNREETRDQ
jgi:hypothetical protein